MDHTKLLAFIAFLSKISLILLFLLMVLAAMRQQSAARRLLAIKCCVVALLVLPAIWPLLPSTEVVLPLAWSAMTDAPLPIPDLPGLHFFIRDTSAILPIPAEQATVDYNWVQLGLYGYASVAAFLLLRVALQVFALHRLQNQLPISLSTQISLAHYQHWQTRLHELCAQQKLRRPVQLMISDQLHSPISWGFLHPVIMVDVRTAQEIDADQVLEHVLAHELAHIAHYDWPLIILARIAAALYWFHPLVWLLLKHLQYHIETHADDRVLSQGTQASAYAQTLVHISGNAAKPLQLSTPLAAQGNTLVSRILAILEPQRQRQALSKSTWIWQLAVSCAIVLPLASLTLVGEQVRWPDELFKANVPHPSQAGALAARALEKLHNSNFTALAVALDSGDFEQRHALQVASFKQRAAIAPLLLALHDEKPQVRSLALWGLSEMRFPETAPVIAQLLKDPAPTVRVQAVRALGDMDQTKWITQMRALLKDTDPSVRANAAHALGDLKDRLSLADLQMASTDQDATVAQEARWAVNEILELEH